MRKRQPRWVAVLLAAGCSEPSAGPIADAAVHASEVEQGGDVMMGMDAIEADAPHDVVPPSDQVTARDDAPTDALSASDVIDAGAPSSSMALTGSFVGGAVSGANNGITLVGHLGWCAVVSGSNEGITLEGVLR